MLKLVAGHHPHDDARVRAALHARGLPFEERRPEPTRPASPFAETCALVASLPRWRGRHGQPWPWLTPPALSDGATEVSGYRAIIDRIDHIDHIDQVDQVDQVGPVNHAEQVAGAQAREVTAGVGCGDGAARGVRLVPVEPAARGRARLLEQWAERTLLPSVEAALWRLPNNAAHARALYQVPDNVLGYAVRSVALGWPLRRSSVLERLARALDPLDEALAETGWLAGAAPSVADVSVAGFLSLLEERDGWETVRSRRRVARLIKTLGGPVVDGSSDAKKSVVEVERVNEEAQQDARRHRTG